MKKTYLLIALIFIPMSAANAGFYTGLKVGSAFNNGPFNAFDANNTKNIHSAKGGAGASFLGGLNAGYDYVMPSSVYLALDTSFLYNSLNNEVRRSNAADGKDNPSIKLKSNFYYSVAGHIGYQLNDCITPFVSLGVSGGNYKLIINNAGAATRGLTANSYQSISKQINGFNPGLGLKVNLHNNLYMTVKYDYLFGPDLSKEFANVPLKWKYQEKIQQHNTTFSLGYAF